MDERRGRWWGGLTLQSFQLPRTQLTPIFAQVLASNPKLRAEYEKARALHARLTSHDIALVNAWRSLHEPPSSQPETGPQQAVLKETGNAYGDKGRFNRITYADTDRASHLQTAPYIPHSQAKLVNAGLGGMVTSPGARRLESYVWEITVAELMKTQLWSDIRKRWQDWQNGQGLSQPPQNTVTNQNDPTASPSQQGAGKGAKKGEAQGQAGAGMPSPEGPEGPDGPNDPNHKKKKGNGDQTSKPEPDSGPRPPWEKDNGELEGKLDGKTMTLRCDRGKEVQAAKNFKEEVKNWLEKKGEKLVESKTRRMGNKGTFITERYSDGTVVSYRAPGQASWRTPPHVATVDVNNCPELMENYSGGEKGFEFKFNSDG